MSLRISTEDGAAEIFAGDQSIARYVVASSAPAVETPKPYLHPLRTLGGAVVTDYAPEDHPWHHGLQLAMPRVGPHNLWGGGTFIDMVRWYEVLEDQGEIRHESWQGEPTAAALTETLSWHGHGGELLLTEKRDLGFDVVGPDASPEGWMLDIRSELSNATDEAVALETPGQRGRPDGGYGGLFLRLASGLSVDEILGDAGGITESGAESDWLVVHARTADGAEVTLGLGHGEGWPRDRRRWLFRIEDFPAIGWAFAYDDGVTLQPGESFSLGHRLVVLDGTRSVDEVVAFLAGA